MRAERECSHRKPSSLLHSGEAKVNPNNWSYLVEVCHQSGSAFPSPLIWSAPQRWWAVSMASNNTWWKPLEPAIFSWSWHDVLHRLRSRCVRCVTFLLLLRLQATDGVSWSFVLCIPIKVESLFPPRTFYPMNQVEYLLGKPCLEKKWI